MTIQIIIKKAIKRLELEGKLLTPDYYAEAFCKEAKIAKMNVEDCFNIKKLTTSLNPEFKKELNQYCIKTMSELIRFLISRLNRTNPSFCSRNLESQVLFTKRILQVVEVLHNKEAADLAKLSFKMLCENPSTVIVDQFRQHWINFITKYDDSFLESIGLIDKNNLTKSIQNLELSSLSKTDDTNFNKVASLLVSSFVPSIASNIDDKIIDISQKINNNPNFLLGSNIEEKIKKVIRLRIALDKKSVKEMIESLDGVLDKLSIRLIEMIESSDNSTVEIQRIKKELELYNTENESNKISFKLTHKKLYTIAVALEENTKSLSNDLKDHSDEVSILSKKIAKLESELKSAREESKEDFLTKLYNKRALDEFMKVKEAEYERYNRNYSIVMLDIDHFKSVNDTYGHDAGDAVLAAFAKILKREARSVDIVGRFGGEEFMVILSETDVDGGVIFAQKVRKKVQKAKFMYKKKRIEITLSAGVSERKKNSSLDNVMKSADDNLYKAKKSGRNQVAK